MTSPSTPLVNVVEILDSKRVPVSAEVRKSRNGPVPYFGATGQVGWIDEALFDETLVLLGEDGVPFLDALKPKAYLISGPSWVNNHAHVLRPIPELVDPWFLCHQLNAIDYLGLVNGTTRLKLTQASMRDIGLWIPPLDEQRRIVAELEEQLGHLEATRTRVEETKSQLEELRSSALGKSVNDAMGIEADVKPLEAIAEVVMGQSPPGSAYNASGIGLPFFQGKAEFTKRHPEVRKWTTEGSKVAEPGDILMSVRAPVGATNVADTTCVIGRGLAAIRAKEDVSQEYLHLLLRAREGELKARATGTTFDAISGKVLRGLLVPVPTKSEQLLVAADLERIESAIDAIGDLLLGIDLDLQSARSSFLHRAFSPPREDS